MNNSYILTNIDKIKRPDNIFVVDVTWVSLKTTQMCMLRFLFDDEDKCQNAIDELQNKYGRVDYIPQQEEFDLIFGMKS